MMSNYNLNYTFNNRLREVPESPEDMLAYISEEEKRLESIAEPKEQVKILGKIGGFARMLEKLNEAERFLRRAFELVIAHDLGAKPWVVTGIRLAHVYQWMGNFGTAKEIFSNIVGMCRKDEEISEYLHFALQHYGKFHFDVEEYEEALKYFEEAMNLRKKIGEGPLIKSTQLAIDVTKRHL